MKYFRMGIFVILRVYLIKKYGYQAQAIFSVFQGFLDHRALALRRLKGQHKATA